MWRGVQNFFGVHDQKYLDILVSLEPVLVQEGIMSGMYRAIMWAIIKLLAPLEGRVHKVVHNLLSGFTNIVSGSYPQFNKLFNMFTKAGLVIGVCAIVYAGIKYMTDNEYTLKKFIRAVVLSGSVFLIGGPILNRATFEVGMGTRDLMGITDVSQIDSEAEDNRDSNHDPYILINNNLYDNLVAVTYYKESDGGILVSNKDGLENIKTQIKSEDDLKNIEINSTIDIPEKYDKDLHNAFKNRIVYTPDGEKMLAERKAGYYFGLEPGYYRYQGNLGTVAFRLLINVLLYLLLAFKFVHLMFEIIFSRTILPLFAFSDMDSNKMLKTLLNGIKNSLITIFFTGLVFVVYNLTLNQVESMNRFFNGTVERVIVQLALALIAVDGPNIAQQLTGVDAGLKSAGESVLGTIRNIGAIGAGLNQGRDNVIKRASSLAKSANDKFDLTGKAKNLGKGLYNEVDQFTGGGISDTVKGAKSAVGQVGQKVKDFAKDNVVEPIKDSYDNVKDQSGKMAQRDIFEPMSEGMQNAKMWAQEKVYPHEQPEKVFSNEAKRDDFAKNQKIRERDREFQKRTGYSNFVPGKNRPESNTNSSFGGSSTETTSEATGEKSKESYGQTASSRSNQVPQTGGTTSGTRPEAKPNFEGTRHHSSQKNHPNQSQKRASSFNANTTSNTDANRVQFDANNYSSQSDFTSSDTNNSEPPNFNETQAPKLDFNKDE